MGQSKAAFIGGVWSCCFDFCLFFKLAWQKTKALSIIVLFLVVVSNFYAINFYLTDPGKRLFDNFQGLFLKQILNWLIILLPKQKVKILSLILLPRLCLSVKFGITFINGEVKTNLLLFLTEARKQ
jgi:hypothetical protein